MPEHFFYHHICQWCSQTRDNEPLKKCSSCKLVSYCSTDHQKHDWTVHKHFCKAIAKVNKTFGFSLFNFQGTTQVGWNQHRTEVMCMVELLLKKKLEMFEKQMILFPNVCNVCFKYNTTYHPCVNCKCTYYCSEEHRISDCSDHEKHCQDLKLCFDLDLLSETDRSSAQRNIDCFSLKKQKFPNDMKEFFKEFSSDELSLEKILLSAELSFILSLLYGLIKSEKHELFVLSVISVHVIGCNEHENSLIKFIKVFLNWLPCLEHVNLTMIGPECDVSTNDFEENNKFKIKKVKGLYHEFAKNSEYECPHIVLAYNCGFSEFVDTGQDTWRETIRCVMNLNKILFITTSYTQLEAQNDFARVIYNSKDGSVEIIIKAERNPFRSLRPIRDWESRSFVFFQNNYISVIYVKHE